MFSGVRNARMSISAAAPLRTTPARTAGSFLSCGFSSRKARAIWRLRERISACRSTRSITACASPRWAAEASSAAPASAQPQ